MKNPNWKQPNPKWQATSIMMGITGFLELIAYHDEMGLPEPVPMEKIKEWAIKALEDAQEMKSFCDSYVKDEW